MNSLSRREGVVTHENPFSLREKAGMRGYKIRRLS
jgi:hypothetical protein